jgi:hypothetical protein
VAYADSALFNAALGDPRETLEESFKNAQIYSLKPNPLMNFPRRFEISAMA